MLNKRHRLKSKRAIETLFKKGRWYKTTHLLFKFHPNSFEHSLFAVSVSKKVDKRAVKRNRLRRQLHEVIRTNLDECQANVSVLVIAKPESLNASFPTLTSEVQQFFKSFKDAK